MRPNKLCLSQPGWFMPGEAEEAAKRLGLTSRLFFIMYLGVCRLEKGREFDHDVFILMPGILGITDRYEYSSGQQGVCVFFENNFCQINPVKPFGCCINNDENSHESRQKIAKAWDIDEHQKYIVTMLNHYSI